MNATLSPAMDETLRFIYTEVIERYAPDCVKTIEFTYTPWVFSLLGSMVIGLAGIFPLIVIPDDTANSAYTNREYCRCCCAFAADSWLERERVHVCLYNSFLLILTLYAMNAVHSNVRDETTLSRCAM